MNNVARKGLAKVGLKNEKGFTISQEYGFTVEEENGSVLAFDLSEHPELGTTLLFGNQVFGLSFWTEGQLEKALSVFTYAVEREKSRRAGHAD